MKRPIILCLLVLLTATLNASNTPLRGYQFQSVIGVPCGGDLPTNLCTSVGDAIALTKTVLSGYSQQGWKLISITPMRYGSGNEGVVFLLGRNPGIYAPVTPPQQFEIVMAMSCGQGPNGLPHHLCTGYGTPLEDVLSGYGGQGWQLVNTTSCTYRYEQSEVGMAVYLLSR